MSRTSRLVMVIFASSIVGAVGMDQPAVTTGPSIPLSLVNETKSSIQRGVNFLVDRQCKDGSWLHSSPITALVCVALHQSKTVKHAPLRMLAVKNGRDFILKNARKNGSIAEAGSKYVNYSTAICLSALAIIDDPRDKEIMRRARHFLIDSQLDEDNASHPTTKDNPYYGGIGYGSAGPKRPDLSNTQWALEALFLTDYLDTETEGASPAWVKKSDLAWENAVRFLAATQKVPESADPQWLVNPEKDSKHDGGFIYKPGDSKVKGEKGAPLSYGSMTYAGLKSLIYANLSKEDYRVKAAMDWARRHYDLTQNPALGADGHYYYLQAFSKCLAAYGEETVATMEGQVTHWRIDLIKQLLRTQKGDGSWINDASGRWMESVPELVTSYAMIALEVAMGSSLEK